MLLKQPLLTSLNFLSAIADRRDDSEKTKREHRFLIYLGTLMSIGGLIWGTISLSAGIFYESFIPYSYALITLVNFTYLYLTKDFQTAQFIQVLASLLLPFVFQFFLGGFVASGAVVLWSILTILGSFTFQNRRTTLKWFFVYLLLIFSCGILDKRLNIITLQVPPEVSLLFITLNIMLISSIIFTLFYYFVKSEDSLRRQLEELANTDPLTEIPNRRSFFTLANLEFERAQRGSKPFTILMFDIDYFKNINDTYGHDVGDKALKEFAALLKEQSRKIDIMGRYGGEEFILLLPETSIENATVFAERVIDNCHKIKLQTVKGVCSFTVSVGLTQLRSSNRDLLEPIKRADLALYEAKASGRDQLKIA